MSLPPVGIDAFRRAAVQKDPDQTLQAVEELFGIDACIEYNPESLEEKAKIYAEIKELLMAYKNSIHLLLSSPIHFAAATGSLNKLKEISDPKMLNIVDQKGLTPLHYAIAFKQKETALYLASQCDPDYRTALGDTYLHYAALQGDLDLLALLLDLQPDASVQNRLGMTPAHLWAAASDDLSGLKKLMDAGAKLDQLSKDVPLTPLEIQVQKLIEMHPDPITDIDFKLLGINLIRSFLSAGLWNLPVQSLRPHRLCYGGLSLLNGTLTLAQQHFVSAIGAPGELQSAVGIPATLIGKFQDWLFSSRISEYKRTAVTASKIASHGFSSLSNWKYADWNTRLMAAGVHLANLSAALFDGYLSYYQPFNFYTSLSALDRIQDPSLLCPDKIEKSEQQACILKSRTLIDPKTDPYDNAQWTPQNIEDRKWEIERELNLQNPPELNSSLMNVRRATGILLGKQI